MSLDDYPTATKVWRDLVRDILGAGTGSSPRGQKVKELIGWQTTIDMKHPLVLAEGRITPGYFDFAFAEPTWIITGDNMLAPMMKAAPSFVRFSDDGRYMRGAYGPKIVDQLTYVVDSIVADPDTRQAVINIWRENPRGSKDVPCTLSLQFLVRSGQIHTVVSMRSSDAWLGWPFDVFSFSMIACWVALLSRERIEHYDHGRLIAGRNWPDAERQKLSELKLGTLTLNAGSQHIYERDFEKTRAAIKNAYEPERSHAPLDPLASFATPDEFLAHLDRLRNGTADASPAFLDDLATR